MLSDLNAKKIVVLGTGGTIAGTADCASDNLGYTAAQRGVGDLLAGIPGLEALLAGYLLDVEQVAQIDSKDMTERLWCTLAQRVSHHLAQPEVTGMVITHGTDTLEETAYFLHRVLPASLLNLKPVVLTCAMRPASALFADGPHNLFDAVTTALSGGTHGVVVVCAGIVHAALDVQKNHTYRLDAFSSGDAGALAYLEEGQLEFIRNWPLAPAALAQAAIEKIAHENAWPRVEIVMSHAGCSGAVVDALRLPCPGVPPLRGLVVAGSGNGTIHQELEAALRRAVQAGVQVRRSTRCANGRVLPTAHSEFADSGGLSPVKARIDLLLSLLADDERAD